MPLRMCGIPVSPLPISLDCQLLTGVDEDARPMAAKYLTKWRPGFGEMLKGPGDEEKKANGIAAAA